MLRIGISGCGYWGGNIVRTLRDIVGVAVEAVADPDPGARQRAAAMLNGAVKTHSTFEYLLADRIDAVVIASPPALHVEQAVAALRRGKAVFVEKPPAMTIPDMERLLNAAVGGTLVCDYVFVHNPLVKFAKGLIEETDFSLEFARLDWTNWGIVRSDVDVWWSVGPHPLSVLCHLFKQNVCVESVRRVRGYAAAHLVIGDAFASAFMSWHHPMKSRHIELVGDTRTIIIDDVTRKLWEITHGEDGKIASPNVVYEPPPLTVALHDFIECVRTGEESVAGPRLIERVTRLMSD